MTDDAAADHPDVRTLPPEHRPPAIAVALAAATLLAVLLIAFAWPAARTEPRDLPIVVAGPETVTGQIAGQLERNAPGTFEVSTVADRSAAVIAIEDRDVYGAIVAGPDAVEILTASAASPAIAQVLGQLAARISAADSPTAAPPKVTDLVPSTSDDPRGGGLAASVLPLVIGGILAGTTLSRLVRSRAQQVAGAVAFAFIGGLAVGVISQFWLGTLAGNYWANGSVVALALGAVSVALIGLDWLAGPGGLGLGAVVILLLGNPLSGVTSAPEMLPSGWGAMGQWMPPGAAGTALRSASFFDYANIGQPLVVLTTWLVGGFTLCLAGTLRRKVGRGGA